MGLMKSMRQPQNQQVLDRRRKVARSSLYFGVHQKKSPHSGQLPDQSRKSLEVEIASQGTTKEESLANLKEALELYFEKELHLPHVFPYKDVSLEKLIVSYA